MDKNAIKKYAIWARRELIARVSQKAEQYGITEQNIIDEHAEKIQGVVLTPAQVRQRQTLIQLIRRDGYQQTMEEVAYTWFNRFIALRFMEVNDYLPGHTCVFTDDQNAFKPKILSDALHLELPGMSMDKVIELKEANKAEELYQYLLITLCNYLNTILPGMFQRIDDYTELLFPEHLLREGSVLEQLVAMIPREDWLDAVQIIGWLYQYYNAEPKDQVFANLKKNIKISKENIPAATQLFTPDWIVRYMVENSLGRLWVEGHPNDNLKSGWKYYLEEAEQESEVQAQLVKIRELYAQMKPEEIRCIDPCMGSGHILVYLFDVLVQIYEAYGYPTREAVASIVQNNLWGLDIDDRAAQLAYFFVMMKARQYDKGWFRRGIEPHVFALQDSPEIKEEILDRFGEQRNAASRVVDTFKNAKEYGSIIQPDVSLEELDALQQVLIHQDEMSTMGNLATQAIVDEMISIMNPLILQARALTQKYHVVVTNPPYMGSNGMSEALSEYVNKYYQDEKSDMFAVFIERAKQMTDESMYYALITQPSILFLASFEKLRRRIVMEQNISSWVHMGRGIFGIDFGSTAFVLRNSYIKHFCARFFRLHARTFQYINPDDIERLFLLAARDESFTYDFSKYDTKTFSFDEQVVLDELDDSSDITVGEQKLHYYAFQDNFKLLPSTPIAYWAGTSVFSAFEKGRPIKSIASPVEGIKTGDNERFLRYWFEVDATATVLLNNGSPKWYKHAKGGPYRRWYGNLEYVINWQNNGEELRHFKKATISNEHLFFTDAFTWSYISAGKISTRCVGNDILYNNKGPACYCSKDIKYYLLGLSNSVVFNYILGFWAATMDYKPGNIAAFPYLNIEDKNTINVLVEDSITLSRIDWDSFEISWDFDVHPIVRWSRNLRDATSIAETLDYYYGYTPEVHSTVELCYMLWQGECDDRFKKLKANEEELNRIFIDIYELQNELTSEVTDRDVTVRKADLGRDIRSLVSYAVGCMLGRYSLDKNGLIYAGGEWDASQYATYPADADGVLPITDDEYFSDDIVTMFVGWTRIVFGPDSLEDNLKYIATALYPNGGGTARELIRQYFLNDFYNDHLKIYQKRPIYWLFDAGKKNSFKCLIYLHRYRPDTIARVRTDYVHEMQARYRTTMEELTHRVDTAVGSERVRLQKQLTKIQGQEEELRKYEEKIHHYADMMLQLDLDDGVKMNYTKLADVLAPIK